MEIVAADIGGTHARFAIAEIGDGRVRSLGELVTLRTADHASLQTAWEAFANRLGRPLPRAAGIAIASPIGGKLIKFTNNPWIIRPALIEERLGLDQSVLVNDFGAVAHAVAQAATDDFLHLCGPDRPLPERGVITLCGPGTGLGVAQVLRTDHGYHVIETEGGHIDYAPLDPIEDRFVAALRPEYTRVSAERIAAGPGIVTIYRTLAALEGRPATLTDDREIWEAALTDSDSVATAALDRFCLALGGITGDLALAHGANAVVIAGGLGYRLRDHLARSGFAARFIAKGRFQTRMAAIPVKLITLAEPGLHGAAAAFAATSRRADA